MYLWNLVMVYKAVEYKINRKNSFCIQLRFTVTSLLLFKLF